MWFIVFGVHSSDRNLGFKKYNLNILILFKDKYISTSKSEIKYFKFTY